MLGIEWHPIHHSLFVTGDSAGTINYYSLTNPDPSEPAASLIEAHEDAVFSLSFHPLGHLLCSGSKDFTSRFWARARPVGGHETDRWHVGEQKSIEMKMDNNKMRQWGAGGNNNVPSKTEERRDEKALPGLPGLSGLGDVKMPPPTSQNGSNSLPGFGSSGAGSGAGWQRSQPLPSQDAIRSSGSGPSRSAGGGNGYDSRENSGPMRHPDRERQMRSGPYDRPLPPSMSQPPQGPPQGYGGPPPGYGQSAPYGNGPPPPSQFPSFPPTNNGPPPPPGGMPPFAGSRPPFPPSQFAPPPGNNYPPPPQGGFGAPPSGPPAGYGRAPLPPGYGQNQNQYGR
jgi:polyadenylation factor subunit 2